MSLLHKVVVLLVASLSVGSVACVIGEKRVEVIEYDPHTATQELVCKSETVKVDLATLTACGGAGGGKGHCYDKTKTPLSADDRFADKDKCKDSEICVPDKILLANGKKLKSCTFRATGKELPGACLTKIPQALSAAFSVLKSDECDEDEGCTPCIDPTNNENTHTCEEQGVYSEPCTGGEMGKKTELCCMGMGICMPAENVPGGGDSLPQDSCKSDANVCAPAALIDGKPEKCDAIGGLDGVCLPTCFADMVKGAQAGLRSSCNALSFCLPCAVVDAAGMKMPGCE